MKSLKQAVCFQADFQLAASAAHAAGTLERTLVDIESEQDSQKARRITALSNLMKLAHQRERYAPPEPEMTDNYILGLLRNAHRHSTVQEFLDAHDRVMDHDRLEGLADDLWERNLEMYRTPGRSV
jgi:hypothetical protein